MPEYKEKFFKILIVGENVQFRNHLATSLRLQNFNVDFATGGFHLMHKLEKDLDYSLLILHEDMNDMPAEEIISLVRINYKKLKLPILFISNTIDENAVLDMIKAGANEFILKTDNILPIIEKAQKYFMFWEKT